MTTRQEDELDLIAMGIAEAVKRSDNLRLVSPWKISTALAALNGLKKDVERRQDGAA